MAGCDYYTCDACGGKSFYDVELGWGGFGSTPPLNRPGLDGLPGCGDIRALCKDCAKTHRIIVVRNPWLIGASRYSSETSPNGMTLGWR